MSAVVTAFLWLVYAALIVVFLSGSLMAAFIVNDLLKARRSSFRRWDREMREFQAAARVTSREVNH